MYKKKWVSLVLITFLMVFVLGPVNYADAYTATEAADEIANVYKYIDEADKPSIRDARTNAQNLSDEELDALTGTLVDALPEEVLDRFDVEKAVQRAAVQAELRTCFRDLAMMAYNEDTVENDLSKYKEDHEGTFKNLFGSSFTVDDLYGLILAMREEMPKVIYQKSNYAIVVENGSDAELIAIIPEIAEDAAENILAQDEYNAFSQKLTEINWTTKMLADAYMDLCDVIDDENSSAELALVKAAVRSQIYLYLCDADENIIEEIKADTSAQREVTVEMPAYFQAYIGSQDTESPNAKANVTTWFKWESSNEQISINDEYPEGQGLTLELTGVPGGTATIIGYRDADENGDPDKDWLVRVNVTVEGEEATTIKGYASWYKVADNAGITVIAKSEEDIVYTVETDEEGLFELALPDGTYTLGLTVEGYLETIVQNVVVADGNLVEVSTSDDRIVMSAGDINKDSLVDLVDLGLLADAYGAQTDDSNYLLAADFDRNGLIDLVDLGYLADHYGEETNTIVWE